MQDPNPPLKNDDELENEDRNEGEVRFVRGRGNTVEYEAIRNTGGNHPKIFKYFNYTKFHAIEGTRDLFTIGPDDSTASRWRVGDWVIYRPAPPDYFWILSDEDFHKKFEFIDPDPMKPETWADGTVALKEAIKQIRINKTPTHVITLSIFVGDPDEWRAVHDALSLYSAEIGPDCLRVDVSSTLVDEVDEPEPVRPMEVLSDVVRVTNKVRQALEDAGIRGDLLQNCLDKIGEADLVFREKDW